MQMKNYYSEESRNPLKRLRMKSFFLEKSLQMSNNLHRKRLSLKKSTKMKIIQRAKTQMKFLWHKKMTFKWMNKRPVHKKALKKMNKLSKLANRLK